MAKGKYQKILERPVEQPLSWDDLQVLAKGKKFKGIYGPMVAIRHNGQDYMKITNPENWKHLLEKEEK